MRWSFALCDLEVHLIAQFLGARAQFQAIDVGEEHGARTDFEDGVDEIDIKVQSVVFVWVKHCVFNDFDAAGVEL